MSAKFKIEEKADGTFWLYHEQEGARVGKFWSLAWNNGFPSVNIAEDAMMRHIRSRTWQYDEKGEPIE